MENFQGRRHQTFVRMKSFGVSHAGDFVAGDLATELFPSLDEIIARLQSHASTESASDGATKEGTTTRRVGRDALRDDLEAISRTTRAMAEDTPGIDDNFRLPRSDSDEALVNAARAFATNAAPLSAQFIRYGLPTDFLADLNSDIANMQAAMVRQVSGLNDRISAGVSIDETIDEGMAIKRKLDAYMRNRYADDEATLAEWAAASHTERSPRRRKSTTPAQSTAPSQSTKGPEGGSSPPA
jgi:hypothetical protein